MREKVIIWPEANVLDSFENCSGFFQLQVTEAGGSVGLYNRERRVWTRPRHGLTQHSAASIHILWLSALRAAVPQLSAAPIHPLLSQTSTRSQGRQAAHESFLCQRRLVTLEKRDVLVSWGCYSKIPQPGWVTQQMFISPSSGGCKFEISGQAGWFLVEVLFLVMSSHGLSWSRQRPLAFLLQEH